MTYLQVPRTVTVPDILQLIRHEAETIPYERVVYALKEMRVKPVFQQTAETMRYCLATHLQGLRITVPLLSLLRDRTPAVVTGTLHILGDKNCLTLLRGSNKNCLQWIVSPMFLDHYNRGE